MAKIPVRFKRVAAAFDEVAKARLCESSGSEHSPLPESFTDLSHLVNCFIEKDGVVIDVNNNNNNNNKDDEDEWNDSELGSNWCDYENKEMLDGLLIGRDCDDDDDDDKRRICEETEFACRVLGERSSQLGFKRRLMSHLRDRGFNAGLCKSRWEKNVKFPAGNHEFVDVNLGSNRYIIEVNLSAQFEIARPTDGYKSLLNLFPPIFVGKPAVLKKILRLLSGAARESIKRADLFLPPWRRNGYVTAKWFSPYKRTINPIPISSKFEDGFAAKRSIGFVAFHVRPFKCSDNFVSKTGQLTATFRGN